MKSSFWNMKARHGKIWKDRRDQREKSTFTTLSNMLNWQIIKDKYCQVFDHVPFLVGVIVLDSVFFMCLYSVCVYRVCVSMIQYLSGAEFNLQPTPHL